jgi:hypothetical protein
MSRRFGFSFDLARKRLSSCPREDGAVTWSVRLPGGGAEYKVLQVVAFAAAWLNRFQGASEFIGWGPPGGRGLGA